MRDVGGHVHPPADAMAPMGPDHAAALRLSQGHDDRADLAEPPARPRRGDPDLEAALGGPDDVACLGRDRADEEGA